MATNFEQRPTAGVIRRLSAMVYDSLLVFGVLFAAGLPTLLLEPSKQQSINNEQVINELPKLVDGWPFQIYLLIIYVSFFCWFWMKNGQTLGMQAWRLKIEGMSGQPIALYQCLLRLAGTFISIFFLVLSYRYKEYLIISVSAAIVATSCYWWIWIDKERLSWHDRLSKSRVVVEAKKSS